MTMRILDDAIQGFNNYTHGGDPSVRSWFLLKSFNEPLVILTCYLLFVKAIGPSYMRDKKPYNIRSLMIVHNFFVSIFYLYFLIRGSIFWYNAGSAMYCGVLKDLPTSTAKEYCILGWQIYIVRYIELLDTVFLVFLKKFNSITKLHLIHHTIVPFLAFIGLRAEMSTYISVLCAANGTVHLIMYTYYAISALGPKYQKYLWWKKYLTSLQILQFVVVTLYFMVTSYAGCTTSKPTVYIYTFVCVMFFFLFLDFYRNAFQKPSSIKDPKTNFATSFTVEQNGFVTDADRRAKECLLKRE